MGLAVVAWTGNGGELSGFVGENATEGFGRPREA